MISEERLENDKISFQMCEGIGSMYIKEYEKFSLHIVFVAFFFDGYSCTSTEKVMLQYLKKYGIQPTDQRQLNLIRYHLSLKCLSLK